MILNFIHRTRDANDIVNSNRETSSCSNPESNVLSAEKKTIMKYYTDVFCVLRARPKQISLSPSLFLLPLLRSDAFDWLVHSSFPFFSVSVIRLAAGEISSSSGHPSSIRGDWLFRMHVLVWITLRRSFIMDLYLNNDSGRILLDEVLAHDQRLPAQTMATDPHVSRTGELIVAIVVSFPIISEMRFFKSPSR